MSKWEISQFIMIFKVNITLNPIVSGILLGECMKCSAFVVLPFFFLIGVRGRQIFAFNVTKFAIRLPRLFAFFIYF